MVVEGAIPLTAPEAPVLQDAESQNSVTISVTSSVAKSLYRQKLESQCDHLVIGLPRGLRFALGPSLAGAKENGATKTYNVIVEHGRPPTVRERLKGASGGSKPVDPAPQRHHSKDPNMDAIIDERYGRSLFRAERLHDFDVKKNIPCLICPQLVPSWREPRGNTEPCASLDDEGRKVFKGELEITPREEKNNRKHSASVQMPTFSVAMKRAEKAELQWERWANTSESEARKQLVGQVCYQVGDCTLSEATRKRERTEDLGRQKKMVQAKASPVDNLPKMPSVHDSEKHQDKQTEVALIRAKGRLNLNSLKTRYEESCSKYRKSRRASGGESNFQKFEKLMKMRAAEQEAQRKERELAELQSRPAVRSPFADMMSFGLSKVKQPDEGANTEANAGSDAGVAAAAVTRTPV